MMNLRSGDSVILRAVGGCPEERATVVSIENGMLLCAIVPEDRDDIGDDDYVETGLVEVTLDEVKADDACPTCGNRPGDGRCCDDPNGCGFGIDEKEA